ncbi:MAG: hydrogenase maturation nickel metallochaperone HypA [Candidatus Hodarchaeota archaeon]
MHEFSLAQSVLETTMTIARENKVERIRKVVLKFGIFALVQEDQFRFCFDLIKVDSDLTASSELEIIWIPGELQCEKCSFKGKIKDSPQDHSELAPIFQCPTCNSYSTTIISGTETIIDSIIV